MQVSEIKSRLKKHLPLSIQITSVDQIATRQKSSVTDVTYVVRPKEGKMPGVKEISEFCLNISKVKTKPISPLILRKSDLIKEINNKKDSILNLIKTGVVLKGESIFLEVIKNVRIWG